MPFLDDELIFEGDNKTLGGVLQNFGNDLQEALRQSLRNKTSGNLSSKNLEQSILFDVKMESLGVWRFRLVMADYADFVDQGVQGEGGRRKTDSPFGNGRKGEAFEKRNTTSPFKFRKKKPPLDDPDNPQAWSLRRYARANGYNEFAMQETIFRSGIKATRFYSDVVTDKLIEKLRISLEKAGARSFELDLVNIFTKEAVGFQTQ